MNDLVVRFNDLNMQWPLPDNASLDALDKALLPGRSYRTQRVIPDWVDVNIDLSNKGVTKQLLWQEYQAEHGSSALGYTQFCNHYRAWKGQQRRSIRPKSTLDRQGKFCVSFSPAVSRKSLKAMRTKIKLHPMVKSCYSLGIEAVAKAINPMIQGWINYYGRFRKSEMSAIYDYINEKLIKWVRRKYKLLKRRKTKSGQGLRELYRQSPWLFAHWRVWKWVAE